MKKELISNVLTIMFSQLGVRDNTKLMRCSILAMEIESNNHTLESIKQTSAYLGVNYDVPISDEFLQSLLDKKKELIDYYNKPQLNT